MKKKITNLILIAGFINIGLMANSSSDCGVFCSYQGCDVWLWNFEDSHTLLVSCDDGYSEGGIFEGSFGGTVCGGVSVDCEAAFE